MIPAGPGCPRGLRIRATTTATALLALAVACGSQDAVRPLPANPGPPGPQTVVLLATPKFIGDFSSPDADVARFLDHYAPLISHASQTVVVFAVANSDQILYYKGKFDWQTNVDWARYIDNMVPISNRTLNYAQISGIVASFHRQAALRGLALQVYDHIDSGNEFAVNVFKELAHPECWPPLYHSWDIRARLHADPGYFASAPTGIPEGTSCGTFLADQVAHYIADLGFDGILYDNQLGTRGRWTVPNGPGYSDAEAAAIYEFWSYSKRVLDGRRLMWFDSYHDIPTERMVWSVPDSGYRLFDYVLAAGFCVITDPSTYAADLRSKLSLKGSTRVLATLDYVDPWYVYESMLAYPEESRALEKIAIAYRDRIDGLFLFANDHNGGLIPDSVVASFAGRFFSSN